MYGRTMTKKRDGRFCIVIGGKRKKTDSAMREKVSMLIPAPWHHGCITKDSKENPVPLLRRKKKRENKRKDKSRGHEAAIRSAICRCWLRLNAAFIAPIVSRLRSGRWEAKDNFGFDTETFV